MDSSGWDERYRSTDLVWGAGPNRFLVEEASSLTPGRALDIACGEGRNAIWLAEQGWAAVGVDFSAVALEKARRLAAERGVDVDWVCADVTAWEPPGVFDLVVVMYVHLPQAGRRAVLARAAGAVAPGGTLLVVGHDITNIAEGHGGPQDPAVLYGPDDVVADIGTDLRVERAERVRRAVPTSEGEVAAIDVLVRARRP